MGYTAEIEAARLLAFGAYILRDTTGSYSNCPQGGEPGCEPYDVPTVDELPGSFTIYHQKDKLWCVPATLQSILDYALPNDGWSGGGTPSGVASIQQGLTSELEDAKGGPFGRNGVSSKYGLTVVNENLNGEYVYTPRTITSSAQLRQVIKNTISWRDMPNFVEINVRSTDWAWSINPYKSTRLTHATLAVEYSSAGSTILVADPYVTGPSQLVEKSSHGMEWLQPQWAIAGEDGHTWALDAGNLFDTLDSGNDKQGNPRKPVWW